MRLIDADALMSAVMAQDVVDKSVVKRLIIQAPTVDAVPVYMVKRMRDAQKRYFRTRDAEALQESKWCEREIDKLISDDGAVQGRLF